MTTDPRAERTPEQRREHELIRLIDEVGRQSVGDDWRIEAAIDIAKALTRPARLERYEAHAPRGATGAETPWDAEIERYTEYVLEHGEENKNTVTMRSLQRAELLAEGYRAGLAAAQERLAGVEAALRTFVAFHNADKLGVVECRCLMCENARGVLAAAEGAGGRDE